MIRHIHSQTKREQTRTMKKKITEKVDTFMTEFKNNIKDYIQGNNLDIIDDKGSDCKGKLLQYIYDYNGVEFCEEDFQKRKE